MTDSSTQQRLQVLNDGSAGPYLRVPYTQLEELKALLSSHEITYWVDEQSISWNNGPYISTVNFGRQGDAAKIQAILDTHR